MFNRKFRWTIEGTFPAGTIEQSFVKVSSRPQYQVEDISLDDTVEYKQLKPIDGKWEPLTTTYYDYDSTTQKGLFAVLAAAYNLMSDPVQLSPLPETYLGEIRLKMYDGVGTLVEEWILKKAWPTSISFGELDHSSSEICTIEVKWRFGEVLYKNRFPTISITPSMPPTIGAFGLMPTMGIGQIGDDIVLK